MYGICSMYLLHPPFLGKPMLYSYLPLGLAGAWVLAKVWRQHLFVHYLLHWPLRGSGLRLAKARCSCHWKVLAIFRDCMLQNLARKSLTHRSIKYNSVTSAAATAGLSFDVLLELKAKSKWQWIGGGWIQIHVGIDECGSGMLGLLWGNAAGQFGLECQRGCLTARFCFGGANSFCHSKVRVRRLGALGD